MEQDRYPLESPRPENRSLTRALLISLLAAAIPILGAFLFPETLEDYEALMWLLLLVPAFMWAFERGWIGVATTLACGMALLSATYAVAEFFGRSVPGLLFAVVVAYVAITLGVGLLGDRFSRVRYGTGPEDPQAMRDPLTALPRRPQAEGHLAMHFASAAARGQPLAVVLFALEDLEAYSTHAGRAAGDAALQIFAALLRKTTRRLDLSARYGSDTFIAIVSGCSEAGALLFAARLKDLIRAAAQDRPLPTVSVGIAGIRPEMTSPLELLEAAEEALAAARRDGRDRVRIHAHAAASLPDLQASAHRMIEHAARARSLDLDPVAAPSGELARDINHLLTMIDGHAERLVAAAGPRSDLRPGLLAIRTAAERANSIARQLAGDAETAALSRDVTAGG